MSFDEYLAELVDGFRGCLVFLFGPLGPLLRWYQRRRLRRKGRR